MARFRTPLGIIGPRDFSITTHQATYVFFSTEDRDNGTRNEWLLTVNPDDWRYFDAGEKGCLYHKKSGLSRPDLSIIAEYTSMCALVDSNVVAGIISDDQATDATKAAVARIAETTRRTSPPGAIANDADRLLGPYKPTASTPSPDESHVCHSSGPDSSLHHSPPSQLLPPQVVSPKEGATQKPNKKQKVCVACECTFIMSDFVHV